MYRKWFESGKRVIDKIREKKIEEMIRTGRHYILVKADIPQFQGTKEEIIRSLEEVREVAPQYGITAEKVYSDIEILDLISGKKCNVSEFLGR